MEINKMNTLAYEEGQLAKWRTAGWILVVPAAVSFLLLVTYFVDVLHSAIIGGPPPEVYQSSPLMTFFWDYSPAVTVHSLFSAGGIYVLALVLVTCSPLYTFKQIRKKKNWLKSIERQVYDDGLGDEYRYRRKRSRA
jgi:hypothetical protein